MADFLDSLLGKYKNSPLDPQATDDAPIFQVPVAEEDPMDVPVRRGGALATHEEIAKIQSFPMSPAEEAAKRSPAQQMDELKLTPGLSDADIEKELVDSTMLDLPPDEEQSSSPVSQASKYKEILDQYKSRQGNLAMLAGANKIAQGFATGSGAKIDDNMDQVKMLQGQLQDPLKQLQAEDAATMMDPASDISKYYREQAYTLLKKLNPEKDYSGVLENMSASQLQKLPGMKNLGAQPQMTWSATDRVDSQGNPIRFNRLTGEYSRADGSTIMPGETTVRDVARRDALTGNYGYVSAGNGMQIVPTNYGAMGKTPEAGTETKAPEYTYGEIFRGAPGQQKEFNSLRDKYIADMKDSREVATSVTNLASKLKPGSDNKVDSGLLGGIQTQAAKMAGQKGVLTDQDLVKFAGAGGVPAKIERIIDGSLFGEMTDSDIKFFKRFAQLMGKSLNQDIINRSEYYTDQAQQLLGATKPDITKENAAKLLGVDKVAPIVQGGDKLTSNSKDLPPVAEGMVRFQDSNGKFHDIPKENLEKARKKDPGLKVIKGE